MKQIIPGIVFLLGIFLIPFCNCADINNTENNTSFYAKLITLTDEDFEDYIASDNYLVVYFDNSNPIKVKLNYTFHLLAEIFNVEKSPLFIAQVNCSESPKTCSKYDMTSFNFIKLFKLDSRWPVNYFTLPLSSQELFYIIGFITNNFDKLDHEFSRWSKYVVELTDYNFKSVTSEGNWFISYSNKLCMESQNFDYVWTNVAAIYRRKSPVKFGNHNYPGRMCDDLKLEWITNGVFDEELTSNQSVRDLISYVDKKLEKLSKESS